MELTVVNLETSSTGRLEDIIIGSAYLPNGSHDHNQEQPEQHLLQFINAHNLGILKVCNKSTFINTRLKEVINVLMRKVVWITLKSEVLTPTSMKLPEKQTGKIIRKPEN